MGRTSNKDNKSVYQLSREELHLTREKASELIGFISPEKIEKIENAKVTVQPEDVLALAKCYKNPGLCNYYCSQECAIGQEYVPSVKIKDLSLIAISALTSLNKMNSSKDRLLEIVEDGKISPDEYKDFIEIKQTLDKIAISVTAMQLWIDQEIANGNIDGTVFQ